MNNITKRPPIGIDDFKELIKGYYFVDKTNFIADILYYGVQVSLITRPRRFGKTLMLSMLNYFFTIDDAENNRAIFNDLKISKLDQRYLDRQGQSPVIFLSLKNLEATNFDLFFEKISSAMGAIYSKFSYILDSSLINKYDKKFFDKLALYEGSIADVERSLLNLMRMLNIYYQKRVILLIDEYDSPIINAWNEKYYDESIEFMRNFFGLSLKSNNYLDFAVLTGITRVAKESIFSGVNNFKSFSVFHNQFSDIFGFTEEEVIKFLDYYNIGYKIDELKEWYDGYCFGNKEIYNPWSIVNFIYEYYFHKNKPSGYWINTSGNNIINYILQNNSIELKEDVQKLMKHGSIIKDIDEYLIYTDIDTNIDALFSILVSTGYLKVINKILNEDTWTCTLTIPNKEVYIAFKKAIADKLPKTCITSLKNILNLLISGDSDAFSKEFKNFLILFTSFFDAAENLQENFYHGLFLGLVATLEKDYVIESNKESGYGRFDIACIPKNKNNSGIILEFKVSKDKNSLYHDADAALQQITDLKYATIFNKYPAKNIWQYGISFYKRDFVLKKKDA